MKQPLAHRKANSFTGLAVVLSALLSIGAVVWLFATVSNITDAEASRRAKIVLNRTGFIQAGTERAAVSQVLNAAGLDICGRVRFLGDLWAGRRAHYPVGRRSYGEVPVHRQRSVSDGCACSSWRGAVRTAAPGIIKLRRALAMQDIREHCPRNMSVNTSRPSRVVEVASAEAIPT